MNAHPNASAAAIAGAIVTVVVWAADEFGRLAIPEFVVAALTTLVLAGVLFLGRRRA